MGNNPISRLRKKHGDRPPRKQDDQSANKPNASPNAVDQHVVNQTNRARGPAANSSNTAPIIPGSRGTDPPESQNAAPVTLTRSIDPPTAVSLSRGNDPAPTVSLTRGT